MQLLVVIKKSNRNRKRSYQVHVVVVSPRNQCVVQATTLRVYPKPGVIGRVVVVRVLLEVLHRKVNR